MDYETVDAQQFGAGLRGIGLNLLVRDVPAQADFLRDVFGMGAHRVSADFAILTYGDQVMQIHADGTYHSHPLLGLLPESPPRVCLTYRAKEIIGALLDISRLDTEDRAFDLAPVRLDDLLPPSGSKRDR